MRITLVQSAFRVIFYRTADVQGDTISIPSPHITDVLVANGNITVCKGKITDVQIYYLNIFGNLGQSIEFGESIMCCTGILIVLVVVAVTFNSILSSKDSNANAVNRQTLIFIAGSGLHRALDGELTVCTDSQAGKCIAQCNAADCPINSLIQLGIAVNTGDFNGVLERQIALVDNAELRQLVCTARLPKNLFVNRCVGSFLEL